MTTTFDASIAYTYGTLIETAYRLFTPGMLDPTAASGQLPAGWTLATALTAIDKVAHKTEPEFFGLIVQSAADTGVLVAIRGTDTLLEWLIDAEFTPRAFQAAPGAGIVRTSSRGCLRSTLLSATRSTSTPPTTQRSRTAWRATTR
jgi:hypothetical protein